MVTLPRIVVAASSSSAGKTTIATGLMAALTRRGHAVAGFKVGPDYIDPGYHALATGRPGRNLDPVLTSEELVPRLLLHGAMVPGPADLAVVEGVMGLFDGRLGTGGFGSTAHVARLVSAPVVLVVDAAGSSRTAAAAALGLRGFDPGVNVAGVIVNRVGSARHGRELRDVFDAAGVPVLGIVPGQPASPRRRGTSGWCPPPSGGLVRNDQALSSTSPHVDLDAVLRWPRPPPGWTRPPGIPPRRSGAGQRRSPGSRWWASWPGGRSPSATPRPMSCCARPGAGWSRSTRSRTPHCPATSPVCTRAGGSPRCTRPSSAATARYGPTSRTPSPTGCRSSPSAPDSCTWAGTWTGTRWLGRCRRPRA